MRSATRWFVLGAVGLSLAGCNTWESVPQSASWESGATSAAGWKTHAGRRAQERILVTEPTVTRLPTYDADYIRTAYNAISQMLATARPAMDGGDSFDRNRPVLYSTTVNLNNYGDTSNFGRLQSEALATALTQHWRNKVLKMTLRHGDVEVVPAGGEFLLSREARQLALDYNAGAALVSTYSVALDKVYVNASLVNVDQNAVVASVMFEIPLGPRTLAMLRNQQFPSDAVGTLSYDRPLTRPAMR
jgi:hypothetical protein